ncbi:MAG: hypothetical protein CEE42_16560 [Promethearchaeota archaeon Loki_b31]|nr:MAG: hypothetical protein CEE42_16560 [Candidatus Lokiarchaeota archaeon Loki_b31]
MYIINKQLEDISESNIQHLIDDERIEKKVLDYKSELPGNSDSEKKDFLANVSSFANAVGGDLIYGVIENRKTGKPEKLEGIEILNVNQEILRLDQIIRNGIEPNIPSSSINIREIQLKNMKYVLIIRINKSGIGPHRVSFKSWHRFYSRGTNGKYPLDVQELRLAFNLSDSIRDKIEREKESPNFKEYDFLKRLIYLLQKYEEINYYEREELETIKEIGKLIEKLDIIKFLKIDRTNYSKFDKLLGETDYSYLDMFLYMRDKNYSITYVSDNLGHWFDISPRNSKITYHSISFCFREFNRSEEIKVLENFIDYLKGRMEELHLFPLLEEIEEKTRIMKKFFRLRKFLEYLFGDDYLNPTVIKERTDERVISELNWIKQNDKELNDYFTVFRRKDEPSKYDKVLSLLNGKYLVQFRSHIPFKSTIKTNGKIIESSATKKVNSTIYEIFESIKNHIEDNYKIKL